MLFCGGCFCCVLLLGIDLIIICFCGEVVGFFGCGLCDGLGEIVGVGCFLDCCCWFCLSMDGMMYFFFLLYGRLWCVLLWIDGRLRGLVWLLGLGFVIVFEIWYFFFKFVYCDFFWLMISEGGRRYDFRIVVWGLFDWNLNLGLKNY